MSPNNISVKFRNKNDVLCKLVEFGIGDLADIHTIEEKASVMPWSKKNFSDSISSCHICVGVKIENTWIAHAVFSVAGDEAELLITAVDPAYQGLGIASNILEIMESILRPKAQEVFLEVRRSNKPAIMLYESLGFNCLGERPNYYPSPNGREDALIYGKCIRL